VLLLPLGFAGASGPLRFDKTLETTASPRISVSNLKGHVVVKSWDKPAVHVTSSGTSPQIEVDIEQYPSAGPAEKIHFTTHVLNNQLSDKSADYTFEIPLDSSLDIRNPEGSVRIEKLRGEASVDTVGGAISVSDESGHLAVRSIGGDIEIVRPSGRVEANSICGSIRIVNPSSARLRAVTTSGKIFYEGDFLPGGEYELSDYSGDTEVLTPQSASFELNAKTVRGKVVADPDIAVTPKRHTPFRPLGSNSLFGTHNAGKATLELTSFSGTIRIRRLP
jgi:DUF4097 and DUF4098 domain-containing protein YvlB